MSFNPTLPPVNNSLTNSFCKDAILLSDTNTEILPTNTLKTIKTLIQTANSFIKNASDSADVSKTVTNKLNDPCNNMREITRENLSDTIKNTRNHLKSIYHKTLSEHNSLKEAFIDEIMVSLEIENSNESMTEEKKLQVQYLEKTPFSEILMDYIDLTKKAEKQLLVPDSGDVSETVINKLNDPCNNMREITRENSSDKISIIHDYFESVYGGDLSDYINEGKALIKDIIALLEKEISNESMTEEEKSKVEIQIQHLQKSPPSEILMDCVNAFKNTEEQLTVMQRTLDGLKTVFKFINLTENFESLDNPKIIFEKPAQQEATGSFNI